MDVGRLPALSKHQSRSSNIFSQGAEGEVSYLIQSLATHTVAGTGAPGDAESVLDGLNDVNEEVERLGEGIGWRGVVEQLRGAGEGHLGVNEHVRQDGTEPVALGDLQVQS